MNKLFLALMSCIVVLKLVASGTEVRSVPKIDECRRIAELLNSAQQIPYEPTRLSVLPSVIRNIIFQLISNESSIGEAAIKAKIFLAAQNKENDALAIDKVARVLAKQFDKTHEQAINELAKVEVPAAINIFLIKAALDAVEKKNIIFFKFLIKKPVVANYFNAFVQSLDVKSEVADTPVDLLTAPCTALHMPSYEEIEHSLGELSIGWFSIPHFGEKRITELYPCEVLVYWNLIRSIPDAYATQNRLAPMLLTAIENLRKIENSAHPYYDNFFDFVKADHERKKAKAKVVRNVLGTIARQYSIPLPSTETKAEALSLIRPLQSQLIISGTGPRSNFYNFP